MTEVKNLRCYELYDYFKANHDDLLKEGWLEAFLTQHCKFKPAGLKGSHLGLLQVPFEFGSYLRFAASIGVRRYLEVGVAFGGSWFVTDSLMRVLFPDYAGSVGYDIANKMEELEAYQKRFPDAVFRQQSSELIDLKEERYDLTLVDARHQEEWVRIDFERVRNNSSYVAFHDIVLPGRRTSVDRFWATVKDVHQSWEFIDKSLNVTCGIGLLRI